MNDRFKKEYYEKSYKSVDGLWFMKTEDADGFDRALDIDAEVWKIMPKIQARMMKTKVKDFADGFRSKLELDGFRVRSVRQAGGEISIETENCPWFDLLKKSNRAHLAEKIGSRICGTEYPVWSEEYGVGLALEFRERICRGGKSCVMRFHKVSQ